MAGVNPIAQVGTRTDIPAPSTYQWSLQDVSDSGAGRTLDGTMQKLRKGQAVTIQLEWQNIKTSDAAKILQAFNPQYINVRYLDPKVGDFVTRTFYVGDRSAPLYSTTNNVWSNVSFNIIQQDITKVAGD